MSEIGWSSVLSPDRLSYFRTCKAKSEASNCTFCEIAMQAGGAAFKVRGPETASFEVAGGEGQIWLFSLCGCLELSDCWSAEPFLSHCWAESCLKVSSRWKVPFSCWAWLHTQDPWEVCKSWYYPVGSPSFCLVCHRLNACRIISPGQYNSF